MTPCSPPYIEIDHTIDNPVILDLSTRKRQELISCTKKVVTDCLNSSHFQVPSTKISLQPSSSGISHTFTNFDHNPAIVNLSSNQKKQELVSCIKRTSTNTSSSHFQAPTKKSCTQPSSSGVGQTKINYSKIQISPEVKQEMVDGIKRLVQKTNKPLEEIQTHYARALRVDLQDIKQIYSAVSNKEQSANEGSLIETYPEERIHPEKRRTS